MLLYVHPQRLGELRRLIADMEAAMDRYVQVGTLTGRRVGDTWQRKAALSSAD